MYSNLKIVPLLIERETPCSLFSDESPKREKESLFVREEKTHFTTLSLSPRVFFFRSLLFVFPRRFFLSLFFKSYYEGEVGKKNEERERRRAILPFVLKPNTLNSFFLQM